MDPVDPEHWSQVIVKVSGKGGGKLSSVQFAVQGRGNTLLEANIFLLSSHLVPPSLSPVSRCRQYFDYYTERRNSKRG